MSPGSSTESYPAFARIGLRENPGKTSTRSAAFVTSTCSNISISANDLCQAVMLTTLLSARNQRRCLSEIETLPHILGFCLYSEALRNIRHHAVRSMLAEALKEVGFTVHQKVQGLATQ
ncbi:hypothetical protein ANN_13524 [Periplaneta americana]|uniref:Uncharacterized protein n=1 Tax=Periplaneta americana TaxID=6978 RepID=A0ABQ8TL40_PERAM|nr:hypothetical protein ANN_13524 [Periplaneta americana]